MRLLNLKNNAKAPTKKINKRGPYNICNLPSLLKSNDCFSLEIMLYW